MKLKLSLSKFWNLKRKTLINILISWSGDMHLLGKIHLILIQQSSKNTKPTLTLQICSKTKSEISTYYFKPLERSALNLTCFIVGAEMVSVKHNTKESTIILIVFYALREVIMVKFLVDFHLCLGSLRITFLLIQNRLYFHWQSQQFITKLTKISLLITITQVLCSNSEIATSKFMLIATVTKIVVQILEDNSCFPTS